MTDKKSDIQRTLEQAIKALAANPDSPESLQIQSAIRQSVAPVEKAYESIISALVRLESGDSSPEAMQDFDNAVSIWENVHKHPLQDSDLENLKNNARELIKARFKRPPEIEDVLDLQSPLNKDFEYDIVGTLGGLRGVWHRLWGLLSLQERFRLEGQRDSDESAVLELKSEFEGQLGRELAGREWEDLKEHARRHAVHHYRSSK